MVTTTKPGASIAELAQDYGLSEAFLYRLARAGKLPGCRRLGGRFICHRETFDAWVRSGTGDERPGEGE